MTFSDQRSGRILLVAHRMVNLAIAGRQRLDGAVAVHAVTAWADSRGIGVYQLPLPYYHLGIEPGARGDNRSDTDVPTYDGERLEFVFSQLDVYRAGGYSVPAAVAISEDLEHVREKHWWRLFTEIAQAHGWEHLSVWSASLNGDHIDGDDPFETGPRT